MVVISMRCTIKPEQTGPSRLSQLACGRYMTGRIIEEENHGKRIWGNFNDR